jgi:hypothetical protein
VRADTKKLYCEFRGTGLGAESDSMISESAFTHVVFSVWASGGARQSRLYVNGAPQSALPGEDTASLADTSEDLVLAETFVGSVDEVAIYDHSLSEERVAAHHAIGRAAIK